MAMSTRPPMVYVVDDDPDVLRAMERLLVSADLAVQTFESPERFLQSSDGALAGCVVLDLAMPGLNGLELQSVLEGRASPLSIVFLSARGNIASSVRAMKQGAVDFLTKPVDGDVLLAAIHVALDKSAARIRQREQATDVETRMATLTERERQVLQQVVTGRRNKQIAAELGAAEKTIKFHRGNMMKKMGVRSVAELVTMIRRQDHGPQTPG